MLTFLAFAGRYHAAWLAHGHAWTRRYAWARLAGPDSHWLWLGGAALFVSAGLVVFAFGVLVGPWWRREVPPRR